MLTWALSQRRVGNDLDFFVLFPVLRTEIPWEQNSYRTQHSWIHTDTTSSLSGSREVGTILLLDFDLLVHLFDVTGDADRVATETKKYVERSCCNFGPAWMMSFRETALHLAEQSNTILTLVVDLSILMTGKWGKCHTFFSGCSSTGILRRYPFST